MQERGGGKGQNRRPVDFGTDFEDSASSAKKPSRPAATPNVATKPPARAQTVASNPATPIPSSPGSAGAERSSSSDFVSSYHKQRQVSAFQESSRTQIDTMLGHAPNRPQGDDGDAPEPPQGAAIDGITPAPGVTDRDLWKAINAPVQSREGRRSPDVYRMVIDQFAVGHNPRYEPDAPDRPRAHIFVWDVTRAMNAEVPHFVGAKELSLGQTCDWIRHEGPMRGWHRTDAMGAVEAANQGLCVLVLPREIRLKLVAVVRPGEPAPDGRPKVSAAAIARGNDLSVQEALGVSAVEYFYHQ